MPCQGSAHFFVPIRARAPLPCCGAAGVVKYGRPVSLDDPLAVDLIVVGSVAVDPLTGCRCGWAGLGGGVRGRQGGLLAGTGPSAGVVHSATRSKEGVQAGPLRQKGVGSSAVAASRPCRPGPTAACCAAHARTGPAFRLPRPPAAAAACRLGKGEGFAELEYGILRWMGAVDDATLVVTTCRDEQVGAGPCAAGGPLARACRVERKGGEGGEGGGPCAF